MGAKKLSEASYPFLKEIDWTSDVYAKLPTQSPTEVIKAVDSMLKLGAAMDPAALKTGVQAHRGHWQHGWQARDQPGGLHCCQLCHRPHDRICASFQDHGCLQRLCQVQPGR